MKHVKLSLLFMLLTVLLVSTCVPLANPMTSNEVVAQTPSTMTLSYTPHDYFYIVNDTDFALTAAAESWEGDGSSEYPFLIQGYEINPMIEDIHIENTRLHFKILDCNITGAIGGIYLENVTNGVIQDCLFSDNAYGIYLVNVTGIDVVDCSFTTPTGYGESAIYMDDAIDCAVSNCVMQGVAGSDAGIYGQLCQGITLYNNTVFEFDNHGIYFAACYDINIIDNTVYWNEALSPTCGVYLVEGTLAHIEGNNITQNMMNGITIDGFFNTTIVDNYIYENWIHGIEIRWADYCIIQDNYIEGNDEGTTGGPLCGISTYFADHIQIIGNEFWWNAQNSITLGYSNFAYVANNYINHSYDHGMWIYLSHNATIENNEIYSAWGLGGGIECGVFVEYSNDTALLNNILGYNTENGVTIVNSYNGELTGNRIFESESLGIYLYIGSGWEISHNVIYDCGEPGIILDGSSHDNLVYYNDIGWCNIFQVGDAGTNNAWNSTGVGNWYSDYNGTGTYTIDGPAGSVDYYPSMSLYLGTTTPSEYEAGTIGNTMTWDASALNPGTYEILIDGVSQGHVAWDGGNIEADVDGLPVGVFNVTIIAYHISGHWLANESVLTVVDTMAPTWTVTPEDQVLDYGEALSYQLEASDPSGIDSWAVNDTTNFAISATGLLTNATALEPGVYFVEITVTDVYAHSVSVTIMITVNEPVPPPDPTILLLTLGGAGAVVIIIVLVIALKKKGT